MKDDIELKAYLATASAWDEDRLRTAEHSAVIAWRIAAVACAVGIGGIATAVALAPLKTVVPYLIRVDSTSGIVDVVPPVSSPIAPGEAVTRHLLQLFVVSKERYLPDLAPVDYALVGSMQSSPLNQKLAKDWDRSNPDSPINRFRDGSVVVVQVNSITFLRRDPDGGAIAQVRFTSTLRPGSGGPEQANQWIATLAFRYTDVAAGSRDRGYNPLGLRVTEYQREAEGDLGTGRGVAP